MHVANRYTAGCFLLALLASCWPVFGGNSTNSVQSAVALLNAGVLPAAEHILRSIAEEADASGRGLDEAVARKWLGVALARSGASRMDEATNELWRATALLEPLAGAGDRTAGTQLGFALFDLAETLRTCVEINLREQRMSGLSSASYFALVHTFVSPAEEALGKASAFYPLDRSADLLCGRAEVTLLLARLQATFLSSSNAAVGYERSVGMFRNAIKTEQSQAKHARNDLVLSATIRIAEISREMAMRDTGTIARGSMAATVKDLEAVQHLSTDNVELASHLLYLKALCALDEGGTNVTPGVAIVIEADLLKAADLVEDMRGKLAVHSSFKNAGSFFSQRTHVYEALGRLYAATHQAEKMLAAIEKMKARAFRDILATPRGPDFDLAALQTHLRREKAGLVEFFYGPEHAWAIWVPPDSSVEIIDLPIDGQSLVIEMSKVRKEFANPRSQRGWMRMLRGNMLPSEEASTKDGFRAANRLYELLLRPLEERAHVTRATRLYVVPHHVMNYISFNSLVTKVDEQNLLKSTFYIQCGLPVTYLPAAAVLSAIGSTKEVTGGTKYVFSRSDFHSIKPTGPGDLAGTISESKSVAEMTSAIVFREGDASESRLRGLPEPFDLLYFATHGVLDAQRPLNSAILLAATDAATPLSDGRITVGELMTDLRGKLQANLVVLSACQTNEGETTPASGDDLAALSRGFIAAGARSVLATQWEASDDTFPKIMGSFLDAWMKHDQPKDKALASALRQFLSMDDSQDLWRHPHFWAPVILLGEAQ